MNNNYLGNVRQWQEMFFNNRYSWTPMMNPDYNMIASAYGIPSRLVVKREELKDAVREMIETPGAFLLHVAVEEEENVMPMVPPGASICDMVLE
jgi:acetolactate synthase-1/2/3 large subunit